MKIKIQIILFVLCVITSQGICSENSRKWSHIKNAAPAVEHAPIVIALRNDLPLLSFLNIEGQPAGLFVDMWKLWAEKNELEIRFQMDKWEVMLDNLKNGSIDIIGILLYSKDRTKWMGFSQPLYEVGLNVFYSNKYGKIHKIKELKGKKIGVVGNTTQERELHKQYPEINIVQFNAVEDMIYGLRDNKIRAFVSSPASVFSILSTTGLQGYLESTDEKLFSRKLHAGILKERKELLALVDKGFDAISNKELSEIESHWMPDPSKRYYIHSDIIRLTEIEDRWLKNHKHVKIAIPPVFPPLMFKGEHSGFQGIVPDYLDVISRYTGIRFEQVSASLSDLPEIIKKKKSDMFPAFTDIQTERFMNLTETVFTLSWVIVNRIDASFLRNTKDLEDVKVAIVKSIPLYDRIIKEYPKMEIFSADNPSDALKAVSTGKADAFIGALPVVAYLIQNYQIANVKIAGSAGYEDFLFKFSVRSDYPELTSIINKVIRSIEQKENDEIFRKWMPVRFDQKINRIEILKWVLRTASVFVLFLFISLFWNRRLAREITERKKVEEDLKEARDAAESANNAKSIFLANMSHEIRTPLNGILGYAQILKCDPLMKERQIDGLSVIEKSGNHLLSLLNDILDLAKVESGKIKLNKTDFNFPEFIQNLCDNISIRTGKKGIDFICEIFPESGKDKFPLHVYGDEMRLRQVLINLLGNAVKFTDKGTIKLNVEMSERLPLGIKFSITDTGVGILPEELPKIFAPFHQSGDYKYQAGGTGLGLPITRNLIELMGGKLQVSSRPGSGSTFSFELLLPQSDCKKENDDLQKQKITGVKGKICKILMVDDNQLNREVFKDLLIPLGFVVIEAENGMDGLKKALEFKPDLIITDLIMPEMNGIELIHQIRQYPELKDKIILAASASVYREDQKNCLDAGADGFISKPVEIYNLLDQLQQFLSLEWIYEDVDENIISKTPEKFILPSIEILEEIQALTHVGDIVEVKNIVGQLKESDKKLIPFVKKLEPLIKNFIFEEIEELMKKYLKADAESKKNQ